MITLCHHAIMIMAIQQACIAAPKLQSHSADAQHYSFSVQVIAHHHPMAVAADAQHEKVHRVLSVLSMSALRPTDTPPL